MNYVEFFFALFILAASVALYLGVRLVMFKFLTARTNKAGTFISRLALPLIFLLVALCIKFTLPGKIPALSAKFYLYIDAAILFFVVFFLVRLLDSALLAWCQHKQVPFPIPKVLHGFILFVLYMTILFVVLKGILGINITPFLATSAILTMVLGLALQGVLNNILSGMSIYFTRSFGRSDWIKTGTQEGEVIDTNWRETRILDRYSNVVVIPNNQVASETLINYSYPDKKTALTLPVRVSFGAPPSSVIEALCQAALDVPEVMRTPAPEAYIIEYDDIGVSYVLKFWIRDFKKKHIITGKVGRLIWYKFKRRNIEIPVPLSRKIADVLGAVGSGRGYAVPEDRKETIFRDLVNSSFLRYQEGEKAGELLIPNGEIRKLASTVTRGIFSPGEILFRQGDRGDSCYVVSSGKIRGIIVYEEKGKKYSTEFTAGPGSIFGEMSLFTGMPRTATGIVEEESELLEIKEEDFALVLSRNPQIAEIIAEIVSQRNKNNQEFLSKIKELSQKDMEESCNKHSILNRLKNLVLLLKK